MSKFQLLNVYLTERLTAAAVEIFAAIETTLIEYQEDISRSEEENGRLRKLLHMVLKPDIKLHRVDHCQFSPILPVSDEYVGLCSPEQQRCEEECPRLAEPTEEDQLPRLEPDTKDLNILTVPLEPDTKDFNILTVPLEPDTKDLNILTVPLEPDTKDLNILTVPLLCVKSECDQEDSPLWRAVEDKERDSLPTITDQQIQTELGGNDGVLNPFDSMPLSAVNQHCIAAQSEMSECLQTGGEEGGGQLGLKPLKSKTTQSCKCKQCGKTFQRSCDLTQHMAVHSQDKPFKCLMCGKCFRVKTECNRHMLIHTGRFKCNACGKCFKAVKLLTRHMSVHSGEKPYRCPHCVKCFTTASGLTSHRKLHTGETIKCKQCGKCFYKISHLTQHIMTHTGEKPFKCIECGRCYSQKSKLKVHMHIHTGEKPFQCKECGMSFRSRDHLTNHGVSHTT